MASYSYRIVNVFTRADDVFSGNPLCVFENAQGLSAAAMQSLALQFNLSETTFILPSTRASARVRIFTPAYEMPFAGHPTLGTAHVCHALGLAGDSSTNLTLEMTAGVIPVQGKVEGKRCRWTLQANAPVWREVERDPVWLAAMLGLQPADIGDRPLWVKAGREQLVVPLASAEAVRRAIADPARLAALRSEDGASMVYVFAIEGPGNGCGAAAAARVLARFFFPGNGGAVLEDPATGSAASNLGGWAVAMGLPLPQLFAISQGEQVGRPSTLDVEVDPQRRIFVSGEVIELGRGVITLP